jgi:hypothetical protein
MDYPCKEAKSFVLPLHHRVRIQSDPPICTWKVDCSRCIVRSALTKRTAGAKLSTARAGPISPDASRSGRPFTRLWRSWRARRGWVSPLKGLRFWWLLAQGLLRGALGYYLSPPWAYEPRARCATPSNSTNASTNPRCTFSSAKSAAMGVRRPRDPEWPGPSPRDAPHHNPRRHPARLGSAVARSQ